MKVMPISHRHKCIFVHIPKCAGTSIENALQMHGSVKDVGIVPQPESVLDEEHLWGRGTQHLTAKQIRERVGIDVFDSYFKFGFVRNPWDRLVSFLSWKAARRRGRRGHGGSLEKKEMYKVLGRLALDRLRGRPVNVHLREQWRFLCDSDGRSLVDLVGRFESLDKDWSQVCSRLEIDTGLERRMVSAHDDYRNCYDAVTREMVGRLYRKDVVMFGYRF